MYKSFSHLHVQVINGDLGYNFDNFNLFWGLCRISWRKSFLTIGSQFSSYVINGVFPASKLLNFNLGEQLRS